MPTNRIAYHDLPRRIRSAIDEVTGPVMSAVSATEGFNSAVAARLATPSGDRFCKALPVDHPRVWTQRREAAVAPYLKDVAPDLLVHLEVDGWDILLFEALDGRRADYRPGSSDLPAVVALLNMIAALPCPPVDLRDMEQRLHDYAADPADLQHVAGSALVHTDLNDANVIVNNGRAWIVDWAWASRGAAWLDPAYWVLWLIAAGHDPAAAEQQASNAPAWHAAPREAVTAFAHMQAKLWNEIAAANTEDPWTTRLAAAARTWAASR